MDRQIYYNGPLVTSSSTVPEARFSTFFPDSLWLRSFPSSLTPGTMNHPLPPKPPISKYFFQAYIPRVRDLGILPAKPTPRRIDCGGCSPVNSEPRFSPGHQLSAIETNGVPPTAESLVLPSGEDNFQDLQSDCDESSVDINIDDLPHPDTLFFGVRNNYDAGSRNLSVSPRCVNGEMCYVSTDLATSEVPEAGPSSSEDHVGANNDIGHVNLILDEGKGCVPEPGPQHSTESTRPDPTHRKRPASAALETGIETRSGPRTRARVRAEARDEASRCFPTSRRVQPYSTAEGELLRKLVVRGLPWEQIENEFGQVFARRNARSLQMRWSRNLKFAVRPGRLSKRGRANDGAGRQCF
ncbi:hypothetical protein BDV26DRAFT_34525 [Aspergillus bertholletiae]|uniref:Myb-like domain-containing protein n=1 Tax=Aspergillus bertholletiae TaxID=1226010 RepID=A0A5N7AXY1_9EURO|nr:hypothetical protein BDV26DRAFT_34525 [Aspergillus bertholletiae]